MFIKLIIGMAFIGFMCSPKADEAISFKQLPVFIQQEVRDIRATCMKDEHGVIFVDEMQGIQTFYLPQDKNPSILVDDRHVCNTQTKGGNCHTWGCDVRIYRQTPPKNWDKLFDEAVLNMVVSTSINNEFILAALSFIGKNEKLCGKALWGSYCDYLLSWRNGAWLWRRLR